MTGNTIELEQLQKLLMRIQDLIRDYADVMDMDESLRNAFIWDIREFVKQHPDFPEALGGVWSLLCEAAS